jgi:magnesium-transporting ATPase (P-type)
MSRKRFGENAFPLSKLSSFLELLFDAMSDTTLVILLVAAAVSIIIGTIENPRSGYGLFYHHYLS